ncbi:alpha/beta hydrolase-fold protein [Oleiagrimonas citrea]|uniref:Enterochelin esterase n=2 Tax=Oleiagrimonas citrea TaxID=1665687 RepID=A0A846ZL31_9GAMM|nr:enterochelin esterase [Oleiagrimonas citrea]
MIRILRSLAVPALFALLLAPVAAKPAAPEARTQMVRVTLDAAMKTPTSGRLLIFAMPLQDAKAAAHGGPLETVDTSPFEPTKTAVAAMEVAHIAPGGTVRMDADEVAFPRPFSQLASGEYAVQAVLDVNHNYNYGGRGEGDLVSKVVTVRLGGVHAATPSLTLSRVLPARMQPWKLPARASEAARKRMQPSLDAAKAHSREIDFVSPALTAFWGRPIHMRGWVLLPPGYAEHKQRHYPTVYFTHGFSANLTTLTYSAGSAWKRMADGETPPMIWVFLDQSGPTGTNEFADSVNNGPWGTALTTELMPKLESEYRMDGRPSGRFLTGHSSGGWATLWLQVRYPKIFGGTWSTSPDPSDFHDFTGPDLYAPHANVYRKPDGSPWPLVRDKGKVIATFEQFAKLERVLGPYGGQMASFEWVFSPRGKDGRPEQMFDRATGDVNPKVVDYWRDHYDIAHRLQAHWSQLKPYLNGKIHVYVGTADTFYLDGSAHKLKAVLDRLGAKASVDFIPGKTHFDIYAKGGDREWLHKEIAWQMYRVARPKAKIPLEYTATTP